MIRTATSIAASVCTCLSIGCLLVLGGCGKGRREALEGTVTLEGKPLAAGRITFIPLPGTLGPAAAGKIVQGRFSILPKEGTFRGTFRAEITATRKTGRKVEEMGVLFDETEQIIPERYNGQSELTVKVQRDGPNRFEFALSSK